MAGDCQQILPVTYQYRNGSARAFFGTTPAGPLPSSSVEPVSLLRSTASMSDKADWSVLVLGFAEAMAHDYLLQSAWETSRCPGRKWSPKPVHRDQAASDQRPRRRAPFSRLTLTPRTALPTARATREAFPHGIPQLRPPSPARSQSALPQISTSY